ncbi:MAG: carbohydrate kinase, partial [Thermoleophilia bacterium]
RTFLHLPGANGALRAEEIEPALLFAGRALHVAGALVMPALDGQPTARLLAEARRRGILTSLDTVYDASGRWQR